jgi:hypothetical protein
MEKCDLKLDYASYEATKWACQNWHYSKTVPAGKLLKIGVWENDVFVGVVLYGRGANQFMPKHLGVDITECCELVRVALNTHKTPTTKIVAISLKILQKTCPKMKIVFSYADITNQGHEGIIYRAGNWKYHGVRTCKGGHFIVNGKLVHNRSLNSKYGKKVNYPKDVLPAPAQSKHFFTYELPKKKMRVTSSSADKFPLSVAGANPSNPLQNSIVENNKNNLT